MASDVYSRAQNVVMLTELKNFTQNISHKNKNDLPVIFQII